MAEIHKSCINCGAKGCGENRPELFPSFCFTANLDKAIQQEAADLYHSDPETAKIAAVAATVEADFYRKYNRVQETVEFLKRMGCKKVGIASCRGLLEESRIFSEILNKHEIENVTAACKMGAIDKTHVGLPHEKKIHHKDGRHESICNPILQAKALAAWGAEYAVLMGLCIGHDSMFIKYATYPVTVMVVKDRIFMHNPAIALYTAHTPFTSFPELKKK